MTRQQFLGFCGTALLCPGGSAAHEEKRMEFYFGAKAPKDRTSDSKPVTPGILYTPETGYGFLVPPDLSVSDSGCRSSKPFTFAVNLPDGNYDVTMVLGDPDTATETTITAESRRLVAERVRTAPGESRPVTITLNLRTPTLKSGGMIGLKGKESEKRDWDGRLTLDFSGGPASLSSILIRPAPHAITVYLAGDSTVTDQDDPPWAAWGQKLPAFFQPGIAIANHAQSGESLHSFRGERRLQKIQETLRAGDYLFLQFAHNDQKAGASFADPFTTYTERLKEYIQVARERKAIPVLVTSMHRRRFDASGHIVPTLGDYPEAMRRLAAMEKVALVDLNRMSKPLFEAMGVEGSKRAFVHYAANSFPGQSEALHDDTHFSDYGADALARCVVRGIRAAVPDLARFLNLAGD